VERFSQRANTKQLPAGQYFLGWIITTDTAERSSSNNMAILMRDHNAAFAKVPSPSLKEVPPVIRANLTSSTAAPKFRVSSGP
jgi:hypothetical protein